MKEDLLFFSGIHTPALIGGEIRMTPSPLTNSIGIFRLVACKKIILFNKSQLEFHLRVVKNVKHYVYLV